MRPSSSDPSGSSSSSRRGFDNSARPSATRWRSPPESFPGRRSSRGPMSSRSVTRCVLRGIVGEARSCAGRSRDFAARRDAETAAHPETRSRSGAGAAARGRAADVSSSVSPSSAMTAAVGPQQSCDHVDQRGLAGAGRAEQAGDAALACRTTASSENSPSCLVTSTAQHGQFPCRRCGGAPREPFGGNQGAHRDHDGNEHQPSPPRCRHRASGSANRSPTKWSGSRRECWRRR